MSTYSLAREIPVVPLVSDADLTGKRGYFVEAASGKIDIVDAVDDLPVGVLLGGEVAGTANPVALPGTVAKVKLNSSPGSVDVGTYLTVAADGTVVADDGAGTRVQVARALESGAGDELIEAQIIEPKALA